MDNKRKWYKAMEILQEFYLIICGNQDKQEEEVWKQYCHKHGRPFKPKKF